MNPFSFFSDLIRRRVFSKPRVYRVDVTKRVKELDYDGMSVAIYNCPICGFNFASWEAHLWLKDVMHPGEDKWKCPYCNAVLEADVEVRIWHLVSE